MSSSFAPARRGRARGSYTSSSFPSSRDTTDDFDTTSTDTDEVKSLRAQYSSQLVTVKELFPSWSDEDALFALQDAQGDVQVAAIRISEGQAQQWGAVKGKKVKKETPAYSSAPASTPSSFAGRGGFAGRGRGGFEGARGGRGGARGVGRGGRGGAVAGTPRAPYTNGASTATSTPASFVDPAPTPAAAAAPAAPAPTPATTTPAPVAPTWVKAAAPPAPVAPAPTVVEPEAKPAAASTTATGGWGDVAAANDKPAAPSSEWGAATEVSTTATVGWGDETPQTNGEATERPETPVAAAPKKPASKTIAPGSKMSWAQIARPPSPPKPTPPPPAPIAAPVSVPVAAPVAEPVAAPEAEPVVEEPAAPVINLPTPNEVPEVPAATSTWNQAPASSLDPWGAAPSPAPLAAGEGWADSVIAANEPASSFDSAPAPEVEAHLPPNDINAAGPIEVSTPAPAVEQQPEPVSAPAASAAPAAAPVDQDKFSSAGPPGLPKRAANTRPQQEAVVLPGASSERNIGVQFGSLNLFDGQPSFGQEAPKEAPQQEAPQQSYSQEAPHQQYQQQQQQPEAHAQEQYQQQSVQEQGVQTAFSQAPPNLYPQANAFSRYPYGQYQQPQQQQQQQQQQPEDLHSSGVSASSPYAPFKPDSVSSPYFQHPAASHSPAPQGQAPQQSSYGAYNAPGQAPGQPAAFASSQSDYSALYGQDALRNMGFYDQYGQVAPNNAFQNPSPLPRPGEDPTSSASHTPAPVTPQPQANQQHPGQAPGNPYMLPYGYPYGYYPSYGHAPPNFGALQQQYSSPYGYGAQQGPFGGQQQQQQQRNQYAPQQPAGGYRGQPSAGGFGQQGQVGGASNGPLGGVQGQQGQQQQGQQGQQAYGQQAYGQQAREREYNSKDLDRSFF